MSKWYMTNTPQLSVQLEKLNSKTLLKTTFMLSTVSNFLPSKRSLASEVQNPKSWVSNLSLTCQQWNSDCSILSSRSSTCLGCQNLNHLLIYSQLMSQLMGRLKKLMLLSKLFKPKSNPYKRKNKLWKFNLKNFLRSKLN